MMKKLFVYFLYVGVALFMLFSIASAQAESPDTRLDQLRARIAELQSQIAALQAQLKILQSSVQLFPAFTKSLKLGSTGEEVKKLQEALSQYPDLYPEGFVTGYFGPRTQVAVKRFQEKYAKDILQLPLPQ